MQYTFAIREYDIDDLFEYFAVYLLYLNFVTFDKFNHPPVVEGETWNSPEVIVYKELQVDGWSVELSFIAHFVLINHNSKYMGEG